MRVRLLSLAMALFAVAAGARGQDDVLRPGGPEEYTVRPLTTTFPRLAYEVVALQDDDEQSGQRNQSENPEKAADGEYWLGVQISPLPELAKKQLGLEQGLVVEEVAPDSPAAKAELKRFDILLKANDASLSDVGDLVKSVDASEGKEMTLTLRREGQDRTVKVVATTRPETAKLDVRVRRPELGEDIKRLEEAIARLKQKMGDKGVDLLFARPAMVGEKAELSRALSYKFGDKPADFPKDLKVQIQKEGPGPAKIRVERGGKEWSITEKDINDLPEDIRPHVMHMLGKGNFIGWGPPNFENRLMRVNPQGRVEGEIRISGEPPLPPRPPMGPRPPLPAKKARPADAPGAPHAEERVVVERRKLESAETNKLDAILKKLESLDRLESDVKELRKELEEVKDKRD